MEILSDAVFHGNVEAKEQIKVGSSIIRTFNHNFNGSERSEWIVSDDPIRVGQVGASNIFSRGSLTIGSNSIQIGKFTGNHGTNEPIDGNHFCQVRTITFPSETSTLASTNDLKNVKTKRIILPSPTGIPSTCSRFYFENSETGCVQELSIDSISEFFIKQVINTDDEGKNVQIDISQINTKQASSNSYCAVFIGNLSTPHENISVGGKYKLILI